MSEELYRGIAIIGMAGRVPGAESIEEFWANLVAGKESISFFSDQELAESGLDVAELKRRGHYVPARGLLKDADCFDAGFFGVHPKEAEVIDLNIGCFWRCVGRRWSVQATRQVVWEGRSAFSRELLLTRITSKCCCSDLI